MCSKTVYFTVSFILQLTRARNNNFPALFRINYSVYFWCHSINMASPEDMKDHMEEIRIHLRGHNLYDIFYGPFRSREQEILKAYIRLAPRDDFKDILDAIDSFPYFDSRKSGKQH